MHVYIHKYHVPIRTASIARMTCACVFARVTFKYVCTHYLSVHTCIICTNLSSINSTRDVCVCMCAWDVTDKYVLFMCLYMHIQQVPIHPASIARMTWDCLVLVLVLIVMALYPVEFAFHGIYIYIYIHIYIHICICIYIYTHIHIYKIFIYVYIRIYIHMHIYISIHTYIHRNKYAYISIYICVH